MARNPVQLNLFKTIYFCQKKNFIAKFCLTGIFTRWEADQFHFVNKGGRGSHSLWHWWSWGPRSISKHPVTIQFTCHTCLSLSPALHTDAHLTVHPATYLSPCPEIHPRPAPVDWFQQTLLSSDSTKSNQKLSGRKHCCLPRTQVIHSNGHIVKIWMQTNIYTFFF